MPAHTVTCPHCYTELRLSLPPGGARGADCPRCRGFVPFDGRPTSAEADTASAVAGKGARDESTVNAPTQILPPDERPPLPHLSPPQQPDEIGRLGEYRVLAELGRGGMGVVFRAEDPALKRLVALKVMLPHHAADPTDKARFLREARAQAKVEHDHVVQIFQVDEANGAPFLAMALLRGQSLGAALLTNPDVPLAEAVRIGREMAEGLAAAHAAGLIHRDIKPGNIWLEGKRRRVKILDFGLARAVSDDPTSDTSAGDEITRRGAIIGTPAYMSPEQAHGETLDPRSDLFSLGTVLYQMIAGKHPFRGNTATALLIAVATEHPRPLSALNRGIPRALDTLVMQLLSKKPDDRPATAEDVATRLQAIEDALSRGPNPVAVPLDRSANDPWENIDQTEELTAEQSRPKFARDATRRTVRRALVGGVIAAVAIVGLAFAALWFARGVVGVEFGDDEAAQRFKSHGRLVLTGRDGEYVVRGDTTRRVPAGQYTARVENEPELMATLSEYTVPRAGRVRVRVVMRPLPAIPYVPPPTLPTNDPERKAAEWLLDRGAKVVVWVGTGAPEPQNPRPVLLGGDWAAHWRPAEQEVVAAADLPKKRFVVTRVSLPRGGPRVTDAGLEVLRGLKHLTWLDLFEAHAGDDTMELLKDMKELSVLNVQRTRVTKEGVKHLKGLTNLAFINLNDCPINDDALQYLGGITRLQRLTLTGTRVTGTGAEYLRELPNLRELDLHLTPISADGVKQVATLPALAELSLDRTPIEDDWLKPLAGMRSLETLFISNSGISDAGLLDAVTGGRLLRLVATQTKVTATGVAEARRASPHTRIEWDAPR